MKMISYDKMWGPIFPRSENWIPSSSIFKLIIQIIGKYRNILTKFSIQSEREMSEWEEDMKIIR